MNILLYNSLTKNLEKFVPVVENEASIYSCGPTVYNYAHIGNMRAFLFADLLQRILRVVGGYDVKWVMNLTDIDDKTIRGSSLNSDSWKEEMGTQTDDPIKNLRNFTEYYQDAFFEDIMNIGIEIEDFLALPAATDFIEEMQQLIMKILENGFAYISEGSVYFDVAKWRRHDTYGKLFKIDFDNFIAGARIDADEYERENASDFVLWKAQKKDEPSWDFNIKGENYPGRPGWHIECSAMEYELLGLPFDIHTGGVDLKFPHHEDEIAQSKAGYGIEPTNYWLHNDFLEVEGEKMSKSAGNFYTVRELMDKGINPLDIRFAMQSAHYRTKFNFTFAGLEAQKKARKRIQDFIYSLLESSSGEIDIDAEAFQSKIFAELANDLHTPKALAVIFTFINSTDPALLNSKSKNALLDVFNNLNKIFNVFSFDESDKENVTIPTEVVKLAEQRWQSKINKDFQKADQIRKQLESEGWLVKDAKDSYEIFKKE